jgi:TPR repeat protein
MSHFPKTTFMKTTLQPLGDTARFAALLLVMGFSSIAHSADTPVDVLNRKAIQGDSNSQFELGRAYMNGTGVARDYTRAMVWYRKSADQGDYRAQTNLASMYRDGKGAPKDINEALNWYRKAAANGAGVATWILCNMLLDGKDVPRDVNEAVHWLKVASGNGMVAAQFKLAELYYRGSEVPVDYKAAADLMEQAAKGGINEAWNYLGMMHENGQGVVKDVKLAAEDYRKCAEAENGNPKGKSNLGRCYMEGIGVEKDLVLAYRWLYEGHKTGEARSTKLLEDLETKLTPEQKKEADRLLEALKLKGATAKS